MARKSYSEEFRRQAVGLYESTPGATLRGIAADLGIVRGTASESAGSCATTPGAGTLCRYQSPSHYENLYTAATLLAAA